MLRARYQLIPVELFLEILLEPSWVHIDSHAIFLDGNFVMMKGDLLFAVDNSTDWTVDRPVMSDVIFLALLV